MNANGCAPEFVLCSTARRAAETWSLVSEVLDNAPEVEMTEDLYHASPQRLLALAQRDSGPACFGDDDRAQPRFPLSSPARWRARGRDDLLNAILAAAYPTCALAGIEFDAACWPDVRPGAGRLTCFVRPRALR